MENINDIYKPTLIFDSDIYKINEKDYIEVQLIKIKDDYFYDVTLVKDRLKIFLGRFEKKFIKLKILCKENRILLYYEDFDSKNHKVGLFDVAGLYDISDNTYLACTKIEALNNFGYDLDNCYLEENDKDTKLIRRDKEKIKRFKLNKDY